MSEKGIFCADVAGGVYVLNFLLCICNNGPQSGPSSITSQPPYFTLSLLFPQTAVTSTDYQIPKNQTLVFHCLAFKCEDSSGTPWISCLQAFIGHFPLYPIFISLSLCLGWAQMLPLPRRVLTRYPWPKDLSLLWLLEQCFLFFLFRAAPTPYGSYQARGWIGATAADLHHSHSNMGSEPHLQPTPQVTATPDPQPTEWGHRSNPHPHGYWLESFPLCHNGNSIEQFFLPLCDSVTFCLAFELQRGRLLFPSTKLWAFEGL